MVLGVISSSITISIIIEYVQQSTRHKVDSFMDYVIVIVRRQANKCASISQPLCWPSFNQLAFYGTLYRYISSLLVDDVLLGCWYALVIVLWVVGGGGGLFTRTTTTTSNDDELFADSILMCPRIQSSSRSFVHWFRCGNNAIQIYSNLPPPQYVPNHLVRIYVVDELSSPHDHTTIDKII